MPKKITFSVNIEIEKLKFLDKMARKEKVSRNFLACSAIDLFITDLKNNKKLQSLLRKKIALLNNKLNPEEAE